MGLSYYAPHNDSNFRSITCSEAIRIGNPGILRMTLIKHKKTISQLDYKILIRECINRKRFNLIAIIETFLIN